MAETLSERVRQFAQDVAAIPVGKACSLARDRVFRSALTVFIYHDVSDAPAPFSRDHNLNVPPALFRKQMEFIRRNFNPISPRALTRGESLPERAALVTFDDGLRSYFTTAAPMMAEVGIPSVIFLNLAPVYGEPFWSGLLSYLATRDDFKAYTEQHAPKSNLPLFLKCSRLLVEQFLRTSGGDVTAALRDYVGAFATKDDVEDMASAGLVFYGNHLFNHDAPVVLADRDFVASYRKNSEALEQFPNHVDLFAFPFGQFGVVYDGRHVELVKRLGARRAFSGIGLVNRDTDAFHLHRISLTSHSRTADRMWFDITKLSLARSAGVFRLKDENAGA